MRKLMRFLSPEDGTGGSGDGNGQAAADAAKAAADAAAAKAAGTGGDVTDAAKAAADAAAAKAAGTGAAAVKIKVGDAEMTAEEAAAELIKHRQTQQSIQALNPIIQAISAKDRAAALKTLDGFFEKEIDPNDIKGRQDRLERQIREQSEMSQAMITLQHLQATHGEGFKGDVLMKQMQDLGIPFDPQNFGKHIELAHKAGQYDVLKANYDKALKDGIEAGVREALKKGAQLDAAGGVQAGGQAAGGKNDSWEGDPIEVAKRKGLKIS